MKSQRSRKVENSSQFRNVEQGIEDPYSEVVTKMDDASKEYGISVCEITVNVNFTRKQIEQTQILATNPEKQYAIRINSGERTFTSLVPLLIVDEIHQLNDDRGPVLEAIISSGRRSRTFQKSSRASCASIIQLNKLCTTGKQPISRLQSGSLL